MAIPQDTISGLDINRTTICYSCGLPDDKMVVNVCVQPIEIDAPDYWQAVSEGFDDLIKQSEIQGEDVISSVWGEYAIIKKIVVESDESDIEDALEWELSQQIVGSIEEYVFDFQQINTPEDEQHKTFLVVGYRDTTVNRLSNLLRSKKLNPLIVDLDIFALINVLELNYDEELATPSLIVFSDEIKTKLILTVNGNFVDLDMVDHTPEMQTTEGFCSAIESYIPKLCAHNQGFGQRDAVKTYITGPYFSQKDVVDSITSTLKNAEILYPFRKVSCSAGMDEVKLMEFAPLLAVSVGLALRDID